jgi:hypothetical protein
MTSPYPAHALFTSFWAAVDSRALSSLERSAASAALLSSLLECVTFIVRRLRSDTQRPLLIGKDDIAMGNDAAHALVTDQYKRVWNELSTGHLKMDYNVAGITIAKGLIALSNEDNGTSTEIFNSSFIFIRYSQICLAGHGMRSLMIYKRKSNSLKMLVLDYPLL